MKKSPVKADQSVYMDAVRVCDMCAQVTSAAVGQAANMAAEPASAKELAAGKEMVRKIARFISRDKSTTRRATLIAVLVNAYAIVKVVGDDDRDDMVREMLKRIDSQLPGIKTRFKETPRHMTLSILPGKKAKR